MTLYEVYNQIWDMLMGRTTGPMTFRLYIQPAMAGIFAIRAGYRDFRQHRPPFLWTIITDPVQRHDLIRQGWKDVGRIFIAAVIIDVIYELIVFNWVYLGQALIVA